MITRNTHRYSIRLPVGNIWKNRNKDHFFKLKTDFFVFQISNDIGDDFIGDTQVATFTPTSKVAEATFTVRDDNLPEQQEVFYLNILTLNQDLRLGDPATITVKVAPSDDAFGVFGFAGVSLFGSFRE